MPPPIAPTVHVKLLGTEAFKDILGDDPLQVTAVLAEVTIGEGYTVTVMVNGAPVQEPETEVGVTT
jgi:hypothetical protein